jgi:penicillin G amidase
LGALFDDFWGFRPLFFRKVTTGQAHWCDNVETLETESCELLAATALRQAAQTLRERYGDDPEAWRWGEAHYADHDHLIFGDTLLGRFFNLRVDSGGDAFTVNAARYAIDGEEAAQTAGPGFRAVYDLADLERSRFIHPTGQSGNPLSKHYRDFLRRWAEVEYLEMVTARERVEENALGTLTLLPER